MNLNAIWKVAIIDDILVLNFFYLLSLGNLGRNGPSSRLSNMFFPRCWVGAKFPIFSQGRC